LYDLVLYVDESVRCAPATPKSILAAGQVGVDRPRDLLEQKVLGQFSDAAGD
jgi:hypothetical protein